MARIITLCYRKIIDETATKQWDKMVFEDSFLEFRLQAQNYSVGTNYSSYADLLHHVHNANRLAGRITPAVTGYMQQLDGIMPDMLNNLGRRFLKFDKYQLEIINSDINDKDKHKIAINFYSAPLVWHDTVASLLLVSEQGSDDGAETLTNLFQIQPYLNIHTIKEITECKCDHRDKSTLPISGV